MKTLENEKIWVCWYYSTRKGKRTKVPIAASGCTTGTDESYRCTWVTKAEAEKAAKEKHYDGIGFVLPPGYFFLDIDNRARDDPFVQMILERFSSYEEYSVSGNGIHILVVPDTMYSCIGNTVLNTPFTAIMKSFAFRCRTSRRTSAAIPTAATWPAPA